MSSFPQLSSFITADAVCHPHPTVTRVAVSIAQFFTRFFFSSFFSLILFLSLSLSSMGGGQTKIFQVNHRIKGQGEEILEISRALSLTEDELNQYWTAFLKIDSDQRGEISLDNFHAYYSLDQTPFSFKVFSLMDTDGSGMISFSEFILSIWSYLSLDINSLAKFSFQLYDYDNSNYMEFNEVQAMIGCVYGSIAESHDRLGKLLELFQNADDPRITIDQFVQYSKQYPLLLYPAFMMQSVLRRGIFGEAYWNGIAAERAIKDMDKPIFDILKDHRRQQQQRGRKKSQVSSEQCFKNIQSVTVPVG